MNHLAVYPIFYIFNSFSMSNLKQIQRGLAWAALSVVIATCLFSLPAFLYNTGIIGPGYSDVDANGIYLEPKFMGLSPNSVFTVIFLGAAASALLVITSVIVSLFSMQQDINDIKKLLNSNNKNSKNNQ